MSYCQFHPMEAATWHCQECFYGLCDNCIDEGQYNRDHHCMVCNTPVKSLGSTNSATPFWRRLEESFRYPLKGDAIALIVGSAMLEAVARSLSGLTGALVELFMTAVIFSYSFECLKQTAMGNMLAPDINKAYGKGIDIMFRLFLVFMGMGLILSAIGNFLGFGMASLFTCLFAIAIPAVVIIYGLTESIIKAVNPRNIVQLISAIGMPYGLILAFFMVMASSVEVIQALLGSGSFITLALQSMTTSYYMIVMFHIMGYMIFQNQGELGYTARENHGITGKARPEPERMKSRIQVLLKEGRYDEMIELYEKAINANPDDKALVEDCFRFLISTNNQAGLGNFASFYMEFLVKRRHEDQLCAAYKRVALVIPDYLPDTAELRHLLAKLLFERGDFKTAVKMLNGLHTAFPGYARLEVAYRLMAECLDALPNMQAQANRYREFALKLAQKNPGSDP